MCTPGVERRCNQTLICLPPTLLFEGSDFLIHLQQQANNAVCKCISKLCSSLPKQENACLDDLCQELRQTLIRLRSLPQTVPGMMAELSVLYNFLYASLLKGKMVCSEKESHSIYSLMSDQEQTVLRSLYRVKELVGAEEPAGAVDKGFELSRETQGSCVQAVALDLINNLQAVSSNGLCYAVGLVDCLWSLICLLGQGPTTVLSCLLPLLDISPDAGIKVLLRHGFIFPLSPQSVILEENQVHEKSGGETSCGFLVQNLASLLCAVSCFRRGEFDACRQYASKVSHAPWSSLATILTARALLDGGRGLEAVGTLHTMLECESNTCNMDLKSYIYKLLAACYSAQSLPHLSIEMYRRSLQLKPDDVSTLYSLALQFRSLSQTESEVRCLCLIVKTLENESASEKTVSSHPLALLDDLLRQLVMAEEEPTLSQALYALASRSADLQRFKESSEWFLKLMKVYQNADARNQNHHQLEQIPDFLTVCQETSQSLLLSGQHDKCLEICNKVLTALSASPSLSDSHLDQSFTVLQSQNPNDSLGVSSSKTNGQKVISEDGVGHLVKTGRKRRFSSAEEIERNTLSEENGEREWMNVKNEVLLMVCVAEVYACRRENCETVSILNRALHRLLACQAGSTGQRSKGRESEGGQVETSDPKRPRFSSAAACDDRDVRNSESEEDSDWRKLTCNICVKLVDAQMRLDSGTQALHFARLALQLQPDSENALYFLTSALEHQARGSDGCQQWLRLRKLPHNTGSVHLQTSLQQKQEQLRNLSTTNTEQQERLGVVTDKQKLQLDINSLQLLLDARTKK